MVFTPLRSIGRRLLMLRQDVLFVIAFGMACAFGGASLVKKTDADPLLGVKAFGALGDGVSDDTQLIQKAIDSASGSVFFPAGTYKITKPLVVNLDKVGPLALSSDGSATLKMSGAGPCLIVKGTHGGTALPSTVRPEVWARERMPLISGLDIAGDHPEADGIHAVGTLMLTIHRVGIRSCRNGVHLKERNRNIIISDCHMYSNSGIGIYYDHVNLHQSNIIGCHISYCAGGGIVCRGGEVRNIQIGTCDIEGNMGKDQDPTANILIDCEGGSTAEVAITGCTIQHSNIKGSANIRILGAGQGIRSGTLGNWGHVTIQGNVLSDVEDNVHLRQCRGVVLTGNTFWMGYKNNLVAESCSHLVVGSNLMERNPAYDYGTSKDTLNSVIFSKCKDCTISSLHLQGVVGKDAGILLDSCERINLTGCSVLDCSPVGIQLRGSTKTQVSGCLVRSSLANVTDRRDSIISIDDDGTNLITGNLTEVAPVVKRKVD